MAQPIHCDYAGCGVLADVLVSRLTDGDSTAWCLPHYVVLCQAVVEGQDQADREAADAEAEARLAHVSAPPETEPPEADPLGAVERAATEGADAFPGTAVTVPRGTSRSRAAYEARRRARGTEPAPDTTIGPDEAPRAPDGLTDDAGEEVAAVE